MRFADSGPTAEEMELINELASWEARVRDTCVYVLSNREHVKVGSARDVWKRMYTIRKKQPHFSEGGLKVVYKDKCGLDIALKAEKYAHSLLPNRIGRSDWFAVSTDHAVMAVKLAVAMVRASA